ncbi:3319_t:CDS:2 [Ambispora leptoticha]|uniref:3319_t:CDS:1 n=1 Tax=Ambispora leptoticha TaxID=144679 RepID=A0A9N9A6Q8_9GLOM|nr:3319_t:CDS:2 [Ambispora leptoticha]
MTDFEVNPFAESTSLDEDYEGISDDQEYRPQSERIPSFAHDFSGFCCQIGSVIRTGEENILITNAQKTNEGGGSNYITYTIRFNDQEVKRRYSEFESLRNSLTRLYPTAIIPPIPEKHSITDYATMQSKAKEDVVIIEKRKRMLLTFLVRIAKHPKLSNSHIFHRFLESGVSWNEVLNSPPLSTLPKNILQVSPTNLPSQSSSNSTSPVSTTNPLLPTPNPSQLLRNPDQRFLDSELFTNKFANHMSQNLEKTNRRLLKRLSDLSNDYAELGAVYNGFSLVEPGGLSNAIEKVGQAVDSSFMAIRNLTTALESEFSEPLQEYSQFAQMIKQVLRYRHMKHLQLELTEETLERQKAAHESLIRSEEEARRLEAALSRSTIEENSLSRSRASLDSEDGNSHIHEGGENGREEDGYHQNGDLSNSATLNHHSKKRSSSKLFSVLSHTIHGIMDVDPEATRRSSIGKTADSIIQLEEALETSKQDLKNISVSIQEDLDRFQRQKVRDIRDMLIAYAKIQIKWCQKNLNSWEEARAEIEKMQT